MSDHNKNKEGHSGGEVHVEIPPATHGIDVKERDPLKINQHLRLTWEETFAEPEPGTFSFDKIWIIAFKAFWGTKLWCYRITTAICAIPAAIIWAINFACLAFVQIWCCTPAFKCYAAMLGITRQYYIACMDACCAPYCSAVGNIFSNIRITLTNKNAA